jgi:response regulator RpfG family c-di-GMP phosphodiesterase
MHDNDELMFAGEEEASPLNGDSPGPWKILIVDDEPEVHNVTRMVLDGTNFDGRGLEFLSAYSGKEAIDHLRQEHDIAMILLDVVMETEDAGLKVAKAVRDEIGNHLVRIVLRTGQPGQAPEEQVILNYDINDYKAKTELTAAKLFTTVVASLRSYRHLRTLETNKKGLETILKASSSIFEVTAMEQFSAGVLTQLTALLNLKEDALYAKTSGFAAVGAGGHLRILTGTGIYAECTNLEVGDVVDPDVLRHLTQARNEHKELYLDDDHYVGYFQAENGSENLLYLQGWKGLSEWDRYLLEIFCANVAIAYDNIALNREILETQREIIWKLGEIVETRSRETGNHVKRVAEYSALLAEAIGLSKDEVAILRFASPMHDVGKMGIPDAILMKPGKLTDEERVQIQMHTQIGHEMLCNSSRELLRAASIVALQHHERYDGNGYPNGLKGEDIHIFGRITAVADVFDALGVKRVYKDAWPMDRILDYFREERGKHFDPVVVDAFFDRLDEFSAIRDSFPDVDD